MGTLVQCWLKYPLLRIASSGIPASRPSGPMASQLPSHREVAPIAMPIPSPPSDSETAHTHDPTRTSSHSQPHRQLASELPPEDMEAFSKNFKRPVFGTLGKYRDHIDRFIDDTSDEMITGLKLHLDNLLIFVSCPLSPRLYLSPGGRAKPSHSLPRPHFSPRSTQECSYTGCHSLASGLLRRPTNCCGCSSCEWTIRPSPNQT